MVCEAIEQRRAANSASNVRSSPGLTSLDDEDPSLSLTAPVRMTRPM